MDYLIELQNNEFQAEFDRLEEEIAAISNEKKKYSIQKPLSPMDVFDDEQFRRRFRLTKSTVRYLYTLIGNELEPLVTRENFTLTGMDKILITLRYFATASYHLVTADFYGVSESSVCNIVRIVSDKIAQLAEQFIKMPSTDEEIENNKLSFFSIAGMPSIIGAIDGTLIKIQKVGGVQNKTDFFSRKQFYCLNVQVVSDAQARILDIVARWPGTVRTMKLFF